MGWGARQVVSKILEGLLVIAIILLILSFLLPWIYDQSTAYGTRDCQSSLKTIGRGLALYHQEHGKLPLQKNATAGTDKVHSWRTAILPFITHKKYAQQYHYDQAWNSPENQKMKPPFWSEKGTYSLFHCPRDTGPVFDTSYVAVVGVDTPIQESHAISFHGISGNQIAKDEKADSKRSSNASNTIIVVEMHRSGIHWMEPRDLKFTDAVKGVDSGSPPGISSPHTFWVHRKVEPGAPALFADGSVRFLSAETDPKVLRSLLEVNSMDKPAEKYGEE